MRIFETHPGTEKKFAGSLISAAHEWGLPGINCSECGRTWSNTGLAYPSLSLSGLPFEKDYRTPRAVALEEFEFLKRRLSAVLPEGTLMLPGTEFGPLVGRARGRFGDFAWVNPWTPLVRNDVYGQMRAAGIDLPISANHNLVFSDKSFDTFVELQVEAFALLKLTSNDLKNSACPACGYVSRRLPNQIDVQQSSLPNHVDLFRARNFTTVLLATDSFVTTIRALGLTGIDFKEADVSY